MIMLKTGIYNINQISEQNTYKGWLGGDQRISVTLYPDILERSNAEELAERILLLFTDERGAYKRTYANRFEQFDQKVLDLMPQYFASAQELIVQDFGISDGRTAVDFFNKLSAVYPNLIYYASDYNPNIYVLEKGNLKVVLSHNDRVIEIVWPPFVFNAANPDRYKHYPLNRLLQIYVNKRLVQPLLQEYHAGKIKARELQLFCPTALNLAKHDDRFNLGQYDVLQPCKATSHIIRAMNLLNVTYFTEPEFKQILRNMYAGLRMHGLLIVGSNQDTGSIVHGGIYQKTSTGFNLVWRSGYGAAIERLILASRAEEIAIPA